MHQGFLLCTAAMGLGRLFAIWPPSPTSIPSFVLLLAPQAPLLPALLLPALAAWASGSMAAVCWELSAAFALLGTSIFPRHFVSQGLLPGPFP